MDILIKNATLISMDEKKEPIQDNMDLLISNGKIVTIGKRIEKENAKEINATGKVVMPGLINTHSHISMSIFRETLDGYELQEWLNEKIWPMEDKLIKEDIYYASMLSCIEMIKTGTTTVNDMYFMAESTIKAARELKIRMQTTRHLMSLTVDGEDRMRELEELIKEYQGKDERLTFNVGIHGLYTSDDVYIPKCVELAKKYDLPIHIHFCENSQEVEDIKNIYHVDSPVELIKRYFEGTHVILAHSVKLSKEELEELSKLDISVSHCPVSNLRLGCGIAKISDMLELGINVTLGTDGQGSGSNLDLFETMKLTALLQKGILEDPKKISAYDVLKMATMNGAKALQLDKKIGSVEEGKDADLIMINLDSIVTKPVNNLLSDIVYNVKGTNVETVIINGEIVMEDRQIQGIDEHKIHEKCQKIIDRIQN